MEEMNEVYTEVMNEEDTYPCEEAGAEVIEDGMSGELLVGLGVIAGAGLMYVGQKIWNSKPVTKLRDSAMERHEEHKKARALKKEEKLRKKELKVVEAEVVDTPEEDLAEAK